MPSRCERRLRALWLSRRPADATEAQGSRPKQAGLDTAAISRPDAAARISRRACQQGALLSGKKCVGEGKLGKMREHTPRTEERARPVGARGAHELSNAM